MEETRGILERIKHHDKLNITINDNCRIVLPDYALQKFIGPYKLSYYCFIFVYQGTSTYRTDLKDTTVANGQVLFGVPNQVFRHYPKSEDERSFKVAFDEALLSLLPVTFPFLLNPLNENVITFDPTSRERIKLLFSILFDLLHSPEQLHHTDVIIAHVNTIMTELNSAYFKQGGGTFSGAKMSQYISFKLAVETHLTDLHDVQAIADKLAMSPASLYNVVKEYSGLSPKEWMTKRLMQEAQRRLQYNRLTVKELAYELGFNDPGYFSRAFKKSTGRSVSSFLSELHDLSRN